ncbi:GAF and ANTAR domain-containing protein [Mycolicibacterium hodleri]|uniref:ANTAR domain-containing protein n=1 Tax=Mycolicibacterium hodleri TaxID=49897 RepID=A0A502DUW4_9MYCO|nr:GAF and ANTAR domain-containing protein [Mycolicibacterium hodleri]TPG28112.1 ANTAR domain-containing protein [Mycolicibacterium hodleri]
MTEPSVPEWVQSLGELATDLQNRDGTESTLSSIVASAVGLVPGARWAGVSVITDGAIEVAASTHSLVAELDEIQVAVGEGPWTSALRQHRSVHVADMATDTRWPRFASAAVARGVGSSLSFRLFAEQHRVGALTLYGSEAGAFTADSLVIGDLLAQHASLAMIGVAVEGQFNRALATRDVIGQAKGLIMHQQNLSGLEAFQLLVRTSQNGNVKLVDVARWLVEQHEASLRGGRR